MQNSRVKNVRKQLLSDNWYRLDKVTYDFRLDNGKWETHEREAYDRGNGATILLYNKQKSTVILTKQFRLPTYLNGNQTGFLIEACAGLLDNDDPIACIKKETEEETGYRVEFIQKVFEAYMSPGSVTELLYFFIAEYSESMKISPGGGLTDEQENIDVMELHIDVAFNMIQTGQIKDAKTTMLLQYVKLNNIFSTFSKDF